MSNDQPARRPPAKSSGGGAPMGSTISIVIAVVAVVVGFVILRNINDTGAGGSPSLPNVSGTTIAGGTPGSTAVTTATTLPAATTPVTTPLVFSPGIVVVANASGIAGAAALATTALKSAGWTMGTATDAFGAQKKITASIVYFMAGSELTAASVAQAFGGPASGVMALPMPAPIPVKNANIGNGTILVMLGTDFANKPLPILAGTSPTATTLATSAINVATTLAG